MANEDDDVQAVFDEVNVLLQEDDQGNRKHKSRLGGPGERVRTGRVGYTLRFEVHDSDDEYYNSDELFTEFDSEENSSKKLARPMESSIGHFEHSCGRVFDNFHNTSKWLASAYLEVFRIDPEWSLNGLIGRVREDYSLTIVGIDPNNFIFPIAYAAMLVENKDSCSGS
ncbi:hypothetical protein GH714_038947 [Hevea brasiliensis]|uniref:Uncharacterized protein n=1 Tax=Hevea brasiliensis TaxID=3981 RepID=A0A6A6KPM6_HEVBR|nr:hypothetical protein GH714_038947 [Hevea brasiliensis]